MYPSSASSSSSLAGNGTEPLFPEQRGLKWRFIAHIPTIITQIHLLCVLLIKPRIDPEIPLQRRPIILPLRHNPRPLGCPPSPLRRPIIPFQEPHPLKRRAIISVATVSGCGSLPQR